MEFSPSDNIRYRCLLLQTYKAFSKFCYDNSIHFCAAGGTMIGAVRHQDMIPWDDDIDVYMKRSDYNKLIASRSLLEGSLYEIIDTTTKGYFCSHAKFSHRFSTIWEFKSIPYVFGAFIDIFVLDYETLTYENVVKKRFKYDQKANFFYVCSNNHPFQEIKKLLNGGEFTKAIWFLFQKMVLRYFHPILGKLLLNNTNNKSGEWLVAYTGTSGVKDIFQSEWFEAYILFPFNDTYINVPVGYDSFLRAMYGDYMTPPPINERDSHHSLFYYNLDRRISKEEIEKIQKGEV